MFIVMNGFSQSGKTTLVDKIKKGFPDSFVSVDSTKIHKFLNETYYVFQDDNTIYGKGYELREKATKDIQNSLQKILLREHLNLIDDSCNSTKEKRTKLISSAKELDQEIKTMIISIDIPEEVLLKKLNELDDEHEQKGEKRAWLDLYENVQKPSFQKPTPEEADIVCFYNRTNKEEIFKNIKELMKKENKKT